ncbi:MAG: class I SAM-dependent methyltransferase [Clostridia bacterium]|nr:class I SAM-dependent methyltransferase [Clostridia bacterium]
MDEQYTMLARHYDTLTFDVDYAGYADFADRLFKKYKIPGNLILEQACGTGSLTLELARRGYEMIASDLSPDMLVAAQEKCVDLPEQPVFICQDMCELDLYGTVDGCVCALDSLNYLTEQWQLKRAIKGVATFLNKGGLFIFDVKTPRMFSELDGVSAVWEEEGLFAAWQYGYDKKSMRAAHAVDLFERQKNGSYKRYGETHYQRAYTREKIEEILGQNGFTIVGVYKDTRLHKADDNTDRLYYAALKK